MTETGTDAQAPPILEFHGEPLAVIEPSAVILRQDVPAHAILCYLQDVIERVVDGSGGRRVAQVRSEIGDNPVHEISYAGRRLALVHPGVGVPLAAGFLEELMALRLRAFVAAGAAGVLVPGVAPGRVIVPTAAVRDEGTSYLYLAPAREVPASPEALAAIVATLERRSVPYVTGKTWTTVQQTVITRWMGRGLGVFLDSPAPLLASWAVIAPFRGTLRGLPPSRFRRKREAAQGEQLCREYVGARAPVAAALEAHLSGIGGGAVSAGRHRVQEVRAPLVGRVPAAQLPGVHARAGLLNRTEPRPGRWGQERQLRHGRPDDLFCADGAPRGIPVPALPDRHRTRPSLQRVLHWSAGHDLRRASTTQRSGPTSRVWASQWRFVSSTQAATAPGQS